MGVAPFDVVLAGKKIYMSNWGGRRPDAGSVTGPAGRGTRVRVDARSIASEGSVTVIDLDGNESEVGNFDRPACGCAGAFAQREISRRRQRGRRHVERD